MKKLLRIIMAFASVGISINGFAMNDELKALILSTSEKALSAKYANDLYSLQVRPLAGVERLKRCDDMQAEIRGNRLYGRVPVHVRCLAPTPWSLYASVDVEIKTAVVVATQPIPRGHRITASQLKTELQPLQAQRAQALKTIEQAVGMVTRRSIRSGQTINLNQLATPNQVSKGERVQIIATSGRVKIQSFGTALSNGKLGEQIEVRNEKSKRIIFPWITATGTVSTRPPSAASNY